MPHAGGSGGDSATGGFTTACDANVWQADSKTRLGVLKRLLANGDAELLNRKHRRRATVWVGRVLRSYLCPRY